MVRANAALTATNAELLASVASLIKANEQLSCQVGNHQVNQNQNNWIQEDTLPRPKTLFPHCKL